MRPQPRVGVGVAQAPLEGARSRRDSRWAAGSELGRERRAEKKGRGECSERGEKRGLSRVQGGQRVRAAASAPRGWRASRISGADRCCSLFKFSASRLDALALQCPLRRPAAGPRSRCGHGYVSATSSLIRRSHLLCALAAVVADGSVAAAHRKQRTAIRRLRESARAAAVRSSSSPGRARCLRVARAVRRERRADRARPVRAAHFAVAAACRHTGHAATLVGPTAPATSAAERRSTTPRHQRAAHLRKAAGADGRRRRSWRPSQRARRPRPGPCRCTTQQPTTAIHDTRDLRDESLVDRDRHTNDGWGFATFRSEDDARRAAALLRSVEFHGRVLRDARSAQARARGAGDGAPRRVRRQRARRATAPAPPSSQCAAAMRRWRVPSASCAPPSTAPPCRRARRGSRGSRRRSRSWSGRAASCASSSGSARGSDARQGRRHDCGGAQGVGRSDRRRGGHRIRGARRVRKSAPRETAPPRPRRQRRARGDAGGGGGGAAEGEEREARAEAQAGKQAAAAHRAWSASGEEEGRRRRAATAGCAEAAAAAFAALRRRARRRAADARRCARLGRRPGRRRRHARRLRGVGGVADGGAVRVGRRAPSAAQGGALCDRHRRVRPSGQPRRPSSRRSASPRRRSAEMGE